MTNETLTEDLAENGLALALVGGEDAGASWEGVPLPALLSGDEDDIDEGEDDFGDMDDDFDDSFDEDDLGDEESDDLNDEEADEDDFDYDDDMDYEDFDE